MELHKSLVQDLILDGWLPPEETSDIARVLGEILLARGLTPWFIDIREGLARLKEPNESLIALGWLSPDRAEKVYKDQYEKGFADGLVAASRRGEPKPSGWWRQKPPQICPECGRTSYGCRCEHCNGDGYSFEGG